MSKPYHAQFIRYGMPQISFWFFQRGITTEREITWTRKKCVSAIFPWRIHVWNFKTLACTVFDERTHNPKSICPINFFEVGGIKRLPFSVIWYILYTSGNAYRLIFSLCICKQWSQKNCIVANKHTSISLIPRYWIKHLGIYYKFMANRFTVYNK